MPTNFLWFAGVSNNGLATTAFAVMTSEINSIASAATTVSSVGGAAGVFTNLYQAQAIWCDMYATLGTATTVSAGGNISGWFLTTFNAATYEPTTVAPPRPPDFVIPLPATNITTGNTYKSMGLVRAPALTYKVMIQNNAGVTLCSTSNTLTLAPFAVQY